MAKYGPEDEEQGIDSLLKDNTFEAAYPLHDSSCGWTNEGFLGYRQVSFEINILIQADRKILILMSFPSIVSDIIKIYSIDYISVFLFLIK